MNIFLVLVIVETLGNIVFGLFFALEPETGWSRRYESTAWTYVKASFFLCTIILLELIAWDVLILLNSKIKISGENYLAFILPPIQHPFEELIVVSVFSFLFLLRLLMTISLKQALNNHYSKILLNGRYQAGITYNPSIKPEHKERIEQIIEDARDGKGLSTVHETFNEASRIFSFDNDNDSQGGDDGDYFLKPNKSFSSRRFNTEGNGSKKMSMGSMSNKLNSFSDIPVMGIIEEEHDKEKDELS